MTIFNHNIIFSKLTTKFNHLATLTFLTSLGLGAQTPSADKNIETIVVTATRDQQNIEQVARTIDVLSSEQLSLTEHSHIQQVFNQLPGVNFHRNSGQEYLAAIRSPVLTGAGACGEFLMLENSIPLRPAGMCNVNELLEAHHQSAESIELLRGPASVMYGGNGLHGVVNVITPILPIESGQTQLAIGSNDYLKLKQSNRFENWRGALTLIQDGGFRDSSSVEQQVITLSHNDENDETSTSSWLTAFNLDQQTAGYLVGTDSYKAPNLITTNPNPEAYRKASGLRLYQTYQTESGWQVSPFVRYSEMEFIQHFLPGQPIEKNQQTSAGVQSKSQYKLNKELSLDFGLDIELANIGLFEYQPNETAGSAFLQATIPQGKHYDYEVNSLSYAAFLLITWQASPKLTLDFGARLEQLEFDYNNKMLSGRTDENGNTCGFGGCRFSRPKSRNDSFSNLSPQLGLNYRISNNNQIYASLVHGFRMPQATELYRLQREQVVADLKPTELLGVDSGWRYRAERFSMNIGVFQYEKSNVIIRNSEFFNISGGETRHKGIEISAEQSLNELYTIKVNASLAKHTYLNNPGISGQDIVNNDIDTAPQEMANVFLDFANGRLVWQLHAQYMGEYFTNPENTNRYSGHVLWHWRSSYQINQKLSVAARIVNLADKKYAERADFSSFAGDRYFPGRPRSFELSFTFQY
ncbi:MAG: TonB-dependent receptor [Gammaproteobacteria bacterium]|nr:TonB-dependent receptor [Gammaproteobacteria bacterium]